MNVGPGITAEFPILTDEQVASVGRRGTRHHTMAGEVLYAAGDWGYDFIVIEAGEVDVLRPAMPNAPEPLLATWGARSLVADRVRIRSRRRDEYARRGRRW
jgi:thioredoxin reductase (NADPH)